MAATFTLTNIEEKLSTHRAFTPDSVVPKARSVRETRKVRALVTGVEPLEHPYNKGVLWLPKAVTVTYERRDDGPWRASVPSLFGHLLKKDGTLGQRDFTHSYWDTYKEPEAPEWATQWVAANMPEEGST